MNVSDANKELDTHIITYSKKVLNFIFYNQICLVCIALANSVLVHFRGDRPHLIGDVIDVHGGRPDDFVVREMMNACCDLSLCQSMLPNWSIWAH